MFEIKAIAHFDAAHQLINYPGKCANVHGHRWKVEVTITGERLNELGILVDFTDIKKYLKEAMDLFDHKMINEVAPFNTINPTAENIAKYLYDFLVLEVNNHISKDVKVKMVTVWEAETACASYSE